MIVHLEWPCGHTTNGDAISADDFERKEGKVLCAMCGCRAMPQSIDGVTHGAFVSPPSALIILPEPSQRSAAEAYEELLSTIIPESVDFFKEKTKDYRGGPAFQLLGARGQFADINRKFWKLYQAVWEGTELSGEQPEEIVQDFIGHCWLMLYCLRAEKGSK